MELRQLAYFEAVVRHGGFSRAAEQLHIAQPAVSSQVRRLERELGAALLERTTRRVRLTPAGELVLARARSALAQVDGARADLAELATVTRGQLRIGATQLLASLDLPRALAGFHRRYPGVTIALRTGLIADLLADLDAGRIDVALCPIHDDLPARYLAQPLAPEVVVLATPPGRYAFAGDAARLADVRDEPFVCLPAGSGLHGILVAAAAAAGFEPRIPFETHSPASICELVAAGLGVALLAGSSARAAGQAIDVHPLQPALAHPPIGLVRRRGRSPGPAARAWAEHLVRACGSRPPAGPAPGPGGIQ
ncbi:MAG: putative LysR-family transcriptional regulator [Actinomycetia bacterium]|nr:putative LysR-family transcriptional regulator [Actinomycetes bacterium]